ncbi:MAG: 3-oxoacid CoA-transferase subunit B [Deltaproteobacteria bacterium]|nr:3-oxoacid CoA-transferase subunit B [Deltaproteobacteria bacterium]
MIALRIANMLEDGSYVNLGIGIPTLVSNWIEGRDINLQSEIGMLKCGPLAEDEEIEQDRINASCEFVMELPGSSYFDIGTSFAMIRGGHIDVAVLGALQVSASGDLAGWNNPARGMGAVGNIGGSMDLAVGAKKVIVAMDHVTVDGKAKILTECTYSLTAKACVDVIVTNYALIEVTPEGLVLKEAIDGVTAEDVQNMTAAPLIIADDFKEMEF